MSSSRCGYSSQLVLWAEGDLFLEGPCGPASHPEKQPRDAYPEGTLPRMGSGGYRGRWGVI